MNLFLDGWNAVERHALTLAGILLLMVWGQLLVHWLLERIFKERCTNTEYHSLTMVGWVLPVAVWAVFLFLSKNLLGDTAGKILALLLIFIPFVIGFKRMFRISPPVLGMGTLFIVILVLNFAFLEQAVFPSYFDSAEHYRLIKEILASNQFAASNSGNYYHLGYHFVAAALSDFFNRPIIDVMFVFGQVVLSALPFSLFVIVKQETGSTIAALFTVFAAGLGWHMPAHLLNWGKYPALLGLTIIQFVIVLLYLVHRHRMADYRLYLLIGVAVIISTLTHTRTLIVYAFLLVAFIVARLVRHPSVFKIIFVLVFGVLAVEVFFVWQSDVLRTLVNSYIKNDLWMLLVVIALFLFAVRSYPKATFLLISWLTLICLGLFIPVELSGLGKQTLLDRPFVQMLTYLPLTIIAGLGLSGLLNLIDRFFPSRSLPAHLTGFLFLGLVILNASQNHEFYPSSCCQFVTRDDLAAIAWSDGNLPPEEKFLIASTSLNVTAFEAPETRTGVDAGIWLTPLLSRQTILAWQDLSFDLPETHMGICERQIDYIYIGGMPQSFNADQLNGLSDWFQPVFSLPAAKIYRVIGCE